MRRLTRLWVIAMMIVGVTLTALVTYPINNPAFAQSEIIALPEIPDEGDVWIIKIHGDIDLGLASYVARSTEEAIEAKAALIIIEINTFGGRVDAATEIRDTLLRSGIATAAWITERAWSAGALISLSADSIWMSPGASIGAAEPRPMDEKTVSALRAEFESMAERVGRDPLIAAAMVDKNVEVPGVSRSGEILTLSARRAEELGYAEGIVSDRADLLYALGVSGRVVHESDINWAERTARFLTAPIISEILLSLAFLGLIAEVTSPGFGVPGIAGLASLLLFFGGRMIVGLVGWEVILLFIIGLVLIALELLVIPGFGITGILGIAALFASMALTYGGIEAAIQSLGIVLLITIVGGWLIWRFGKRTGLWRRLILTDVSGGADSTGAQSSTGARMDLLGKEGRSLTVLRPAGVVLIDGERIDAVSEGSYIPEGQTVVVYKIDGNRIVVREKT